MSETKKISLMKEKWISVDFTVPISQSTMDYYVKIGFIDKNVTPRIFVNNVIILPFAMYVQNKNKKLTYSYVLNDFGIPCVRIRFRDMIPEDKDINNYVFRGSEIGNPEEYMMSPNTFMDLIKVFEGMETKIRTFFVGEKNQKNLNHGYFLGYSNSTDNIPIVRYIQGTFSYRYLFEDRLKFFLENRGFDKKLFNISTPELINYIFDKEHTNEYMQKYCSDIRDILNNHDYVEPKKSVLRKILERVRWK